MKATLHHFTVTCPTCRVRHEWVSEIFPQSKKAAQKTTNHIDCCGHEIGFSVRRQAATMEQAAAELLEVAKELLEAIDTHFGIDPSTAPKPGNLRWRVVAAIAKAEGGAA